MGDGVREAVDLRHCVSELAENRLCSLVYGRCMSRTTIDIDDELCQRVMSRYHLTTKRDAVNLALRSLAGEPLEIDEARALRGSGWDGDLEEMRSSRT